MSPMAKHIWKKESKKTQRNEKYVTSKIKTQNVG